MPYYEQPGRTTAIDPNGKKLITIVYLGDEEAPDPGLGPVRSKTVTRDVAGQIRTSYQIENNDDDNPGPGGPGVSIEIISAVRTVPIEAHPNFSEPFLYPEDKKKIRDAVQVPDRSPTFENTNDTARAVSLYGYLINGVESYYVPSLVVRKTYPSTSPAPVKTIGKISNPGVSIPGVPAGANFLLISISSRGSPGAYQITEEYEMSGEKGWDTFLYG